MGASKNVPTIIYLDLQIVIKKCEAFQWQTLEIPSGLNILIHKYLGQEHSFD